MEATIRLRTIGTASLAAMLLAIVSSTPARVQAEGTPDSRAACAVPVSAATPLPPLTARDVALEPGKTVSDFLAAFSDGEPRDSLARYFTSSRRWEIENGLPIEYLLRVQNTPAWYTIDPQIAPVACSQSVWVAATLFWGSGTEERKLFRLVREDGVWRISSV